MEKKFKPLERIALCLSGGGYRASTFQLGMMSYLDLKEYKGNQLLENVKAISTVSGGTITGVYYAALIQEGKPFKEIYKELLNWLSTADLVKEGFIKLNSNGAWKYDYKRKNVINAFAELYDDSLLHGRTMKLFDDFSNSHLEFVCFNATEFYTGLRYRFQTSYFGSGGLRLGKDIYSNFRLGDVIASSSAFSGGFEPISMPDDFLDPKSKEYAEIKLKKAYKDQEVGLMDGGIVDNQGISSIEDYADNKNVDPFDLILVSDVASPYIDPFKFSELNSGGIREKTLNNIIRRYKFTRAFILVSILLLIAAGIFLLYKSELKDSTIFGLGIALSGLALLLMIAYLVIRSKIRKLLSVLKKYTHKIVPKFFRDRFPYIEINKVKIKYLEGLLMDRALSLKLLVPNLFLRQIRSLHYNRLYDNPAYDFKRMDCLIKELTQIDFNKKLEKDYSEIAAYLPNDFKGETYEEIMGAEIKEYLDEAARFGTTLWFTHQDKLAGQLKSLIISGQVTCCQNLLIYLTKLIHDPKSGFKDLTAKDQKELITLQESTLKDWRKLKKEPSFLYDSLI